MIDWRKQTNKQKTPSNWGWWSGWSSICGLLRCGNSHCSYRAPRAAALLGLPQHSGFVCWRSEQHPTDSFLFVFWSFILEKHVQQVSAQGRAEGWCRMCTGAGSVFVNLPHTSALWQQMWCCIPGHDCRRAAACVGGMPLHSDLPTCKLSK